MKIAHVQNWYVPKLGYQENFLPAEQKYLGHDVEIITSDRHPAYKGFENHVSKICGTRYIGKGTYYDNGVKIHRLSSIVEFDGQIIQKDLKEELRSIKPDIVHAHGAFTPSTLQTIIYCKALGYRLFIDDHSHYANFRPNSVLKRCYIRLCKSVYQNYLDSISYLMPVTYASKQILNEILDLPSSKIRMLHLGAEDDRFYKSNDFRRIGRKELGISDDEFLIISSGKFDENKDIDILLKSFNELKFKRIKLLLLGGGPDKYLKNINNIIDMLGIYDKVILNGFVQNSDLPKYYNAADLGVWPGDHTITVLEAVASGLPVIVPKDDLAYRVLFDNYSALGFYRGNYENLSIIMKMLIENEDARLTLSHNGIKLISEMLSWRRIAEESISIYSNNIS